MAIAAPKLTPEVRARIYKAVVALIPILVITGYLSPELAEPIVTIIVAVLGVGGSLLANGNVSHGPADLAR